MEQNNELKIFYELMEDIEECLTEEDVTEVDVTEEEEAEPIDCYTESLLLPRGGVFKGDFGSVTKAQVKAANREWRRRKSTGRFYDDGSRWN